MSVRAALLLLNHMEPNKQPSAEKPPVPTDVQSLIASFEQLLSTGQPLSDGGHRALAFSQLNT